MYLLFGISLFKVYTEPLGLVGGCDELPVALVKKVNFSEPVMTSVK